LADGEAAEAFEVEQKAWQITRAERDRWHMSGTAWRLGSILVALGRPVDGALAHAAGTIAFEEMSGVVHPAVDEHLRTLERLRLRPRLELGEKGLELQWQRAQKLSLEEAVEAALAGA
jgi:hypothetical protein